jgi:hypothetical protein
MNNIVAESTVMKNLALLLDLDSDALKSTKVW